MILLCTGIKYIHSAVSAWTFQLTIANGSGRQGVLFVARAVITTLDRLGRATILPFV
jgi:hypothetical protein